MCICVISKVWYAIHYYTSSPSIPCREVIVRTHLYIICIGTPDFIHLSWEAVKHLLM